MPKTRRPVIATRKRPQQARSAELVSAVLEAATKVLAMEGADRFTTARVAEKAGVSIGSVYQYFPNKAAILFQLQMDEWHRTTEMLRRILEDPRHAWIERMRTLVHAFIQSEYERAELRTALHDAAPLYRETPEAQQVKASANRTFASYMKEVLPKAPATKRALAGDLLITTLNAFGSSFSRVPRSQAERKSYSDAMADMFCAYLKLLVRA